YIALLLNVPEHRDGGRYQTAQTGAATRKALRRVRDTRALPDHPAELVRLRETLRRQTAGIGAAALPLGELLHGRGEFAAGGVLPGQPRLGVEHDDVREAAVLVFLQANAAAAGHLRHLVER